MLNYRGSVVPCFIYTCRCKCMNIVRSTQVQIQRAWEGKGTHHNAYASPLWVVAAVAQHKCNDFSDAC